ncbi:MAG: helix-turn-helix domain-containing protein [Streptococcus parauberis]
MELTKMSRELVKSFDSYKSIYELYARQHGLQGKSLQILLWIYNNPKGVTQKYLSNRTLSTKQVINATIKTWLQKGYVTMQEYEDDRRQKVIMLTAKGNVFAQKIIIPMEKIELVAIASLAVEEREQFVKLLKEYTTYLVKEMENL